MCIPNCPTCEIALASKKTLKGIVWQCGSCHGSMVNLAVLRRHLAKSIVKKFWLESLSKSVPSEIKCPSCACIFSSFTTCTAELAFTLDLCKNCQLIWFGKRELDAVIGVRKELSEESVRAIAYAEVQLENERKRFEKKVETVIEVITFLLKPL